MRSGASFVVNGNNRLHI